MSTTSRFGRSLRITCAFAFGLATALSAAPAFAAQWQERVNYGANTIMDLYIPDRVDDSPGIVVSLHYCSGNAGNAHGWFQSYADMYGFLIIAPGAGGNCFDATATRAGERENISKMVDYAVRMHGADPTRVFAAGASSGACMTQALLATYPEVFAGGSVLAGVPAGAWTGGNSYAWDTPSNRSAQQWGDIVRNASPGFTGQRPRIQLWHGTGDTTLTYNPNFPAEEAQWSNVLMVSNPTESTFQGGQDMWARKSYKNDAGELVLETNVAMNAPHDLSGRGLWTDVVRFFGLDKDPAPGSGGAGGMGGAAGAAGSATAGGGAGGVGGASTGGATAGGMAGSTGGVATAGSNTGGIASAGAGMGGSASGSTSTAGSVSSGGVATAGTTSASAGTTAMAGRPAGTAGTSAAGASGKGGSPSGGDLADKTVDDDGGCSMHGGSGRGRLGALLAGLTALGIAFRRRRRPAA